MQAALAHAHGLAPYAAGLGPQALRHRLAVAVIAVGAWAATLAVRGRRLIGSFLRLGNQHQQACPAWRVSPRQRRLGLVEMDTAAILYIVFGAYVAVLASAWSVVVILYTFRERRRPAEEGADGNAIAGKEDATPAAVPSTSAPKSGRPCNVSMAGGQALEQVETLEPPPGDEYLGAVRHLGPVRAGARNSAASKASAAYSFDGLTPEDGDGPMPAPASTNVGFCGKVKKAPSPWQDGGDVSECTTIKWGSPPKPVITTLIDLDTGQMQTDEEHSCRPHADRRSGWCHGLLVCRAGHCLCCGNG